MANKLQPQSVDQAFQQQGLSQWWKNPTQRFGQNQGGFGTEEGTDFGVPYGTKIGSISSGTIVYVGGGGYNDPSLGTIVQVKNTNGSVYHYQHLSSSNLKVGQKVNPGDVIGLSGGQPGQFSSGPHIEVRYATQYDPSLNLWLQHWIDPLQIIQGSASGNPNIIGSATTSFGNVVGGQPIFASFLGASFSFPQISLGPTDDVTKVLWSIDEIMQVVPPWNVVTAQQDGIPALGLTFIDPISWFEGFLFNIGADALALILRIILLFWGAFLGYKALSSFIDFGAIASQGAQTAGEVAKLAALFV